ncbi:MAG TPA: glycosyltransferase [Conexibacter sp.]|jgi:GT2 family glycosyltransferase
MSDANETSGAPLASEAQPASDAPLASVLVPVLNEERFIADAAEAMASQQLDGDLELLFADGGSTDRTREILTALAAKDPRIKLLDNPRRTIPSGLNVALRHARSEYIVRMDAHTLYPPNYIHDGIERLRRGDVAWVSGPAIPRPTGPVSRAVTLALATPLGQGGASKWGTGEEDGGEVELDTGVFAGVWRREDVLRHGGWDEEWPYNEDSELASRFLANGERLVCLGSMGAHYAPRDSLGGLWRQYGNYGYYRAKTARRHPHSARRSHVLTPGIALTLAAAVAAPRPLRRLARAGVAAYGAALLLETARAARSEPLGDALRLAPALVAMHVGHGVGVLRGIARFGLPLGAVAHIAGLRRGQTASPVEVDAPSLQHR